jgi:hypothetical protein
MMSMKRLAILGAASTFALWAGGAQADVFTLNLTTTAAPVFSSSDSGGISDVRFDATLTGFDANAPVSVEVGDEVIVNLTFTGGPVTLPAASDLSLVSFFLSSSDFPAGNTATNGTTTLLDGGAPVASDSDVATTANGVSVLPIFFGPVGPLTFDSLTSDFIIQKIAGSTDPGTFGVINLGSIDGESRSFDAVPEPASWALMLMGFGGLGAVLRARRQHRFA